MCCHGNQKHQCNECQCPHNNTRKSCEECLKKTLCEHNNNKYRCTECNGPKVYKVKLCEHGSRPYNCKLCHGGGICEHGTRRNRCLICKGSQTCGHGKQKCRCKICDGRDLCKGPLCENRANPQYEGHCLFCYVNLFPDKTNVRNYKTKERTVVDSILEKFPDYDWVLDKRVQDGCSKRRPDMLLDLGDKVIIIEIDENKHDTYDCTCENKRLMELSLDLDHRPMIMIRFNPDKYTTFDGVEVKSCWKLHRKTGVISIDTKKKDEWEDRLKALKLVIEYWAEEAEDTDKMVEIVELFY